MRRVVAIHQPNFFPWLGFFDKIRKADVFIFLDAVDYPRSGSGGMGSYTNRVQLSIQGQARWVTCPIRRLPLGAPIHAAEIDDTQPWRKKLLKTLDANYRRAPRFSETMTMLEPLITAPTLRLADFNISAVIAIAGQLGLETQFMRQSDVPHEGRSTELLASLVQGAGGDTYLAGGGAGAYQQDEVFAERGLALLYQRFKPTPYGDTKAFLPGLSIIDYLMRDGTGLARERVEYAEACAGADASLTREDQA